MSTKENIEEKTSIAVSVLKYLGMAALAFTAIVWLPIMLLGLLFCLPFILLCNLFDSSKTSGKV